MEEGVPVRAIARGLSVLQTINRGGSVSLTQVARETGMPYPTVCRVVQTLLYEGYIEKEPNRKRYRPTILVQSLATGFQDDSQLVAVARPHMVALTKKLGWPITLATRVGNMMVVRDSTHTLTSLTLSHYAPGFTLPIAECSTGKAYLAFCSPEELESIRVGLKQTQEGPDKLALLLTSNDAMIDQIRAQGYATQARNAYTSNPGKTSSIAVPILKDGQVHGSVALIFFVAAMKMQEAERRFVDDLVATAQAISKEI